MKQCATASELSSPSFYQEVVEATKNGIIQRNSILSHVIDSLVKEIREKILEEAYQGYFRIRLVCSMDMDMRWCIGQVNAPVGWCPGFISQSSDYPEAMRIFYSCRDGVFQKLKRYFAAEGFNVTDNLDDGASNASMSMLISWGRGDLLVNAEQ